MIPSSHYGERTGDDRAVDPTRAEVERRTPGAFGHMPGTPRPKPVRDTSNRSARMKHARMMRATVRRASEPRTVPTRSLRTATTRELRRMLSASCPAWAWREDATAVIAEQKRRTTRARGA